MNDTFSGKLIGVDIGGSHITVAELSNAHFIKEETLIRKKVDSHGSAEAILSVWITALKDVIAGADPENVRIGIAMPGPFDYPNGISYIKDLNKYDAIYGMNIKNLLSSSLGVPESNILFRNDAEAFLHGEVTALKIPKGVKVIGVTLGTGLGSAISINGLTNDVFRAILPFNGGIAEDFISTRWFQKRYKELSGKPLKNVEALLSEPDEHLKKKLFSEFGANLGKFLNDFSEEEATEVIVIGGNIARCMDVFKEYLVEHFENKGVTIYQSTLWEYAALIGAAHSFTDEQSSITNNTIELKPQENKKTKLIC